MSKFASAKFSLLRLILASAEYLIAESISIGSNTSEANAFDSNESIDGDCACVGAVIERSKHVRMEKAI